MPGQVEEIRWEAGIGAWCLASAPPDVPLAGLVKEFWEVEGALDAFRETLLPNGCTELMINLGPPHDLIQGGVRETWERAWISGLQERSLTIESLHGTHLVSVRMHPQHLSELLGRRVNVANSVVDLEIVLGPEGRDIRERVTAAATPAARFSVLEEALLRSRDASLAPPDFVLQAVRQIEASHGNLRVAELHESLGISRKHLAVSFSRHVGVSMKAFAQIQRFTWTMARLREAVDVDWATLALDAGYSDQSHLVRDFRRIGAATPTEYLRKRSPDGTALLYEPG
jgi:AraC-like DNA-binding protein